MLKCVCVVLCYVVWCCSALLGVAVLRCVISHCFVWFHVKLNRIVFALVVVKVLVLALCCAW